MNNPNYVGPDIAKEMHDILSTELYKVRDPATVPQPDYPRCHKDYIWEIEYGVFDFQDETENLYGGRYSSIEAAEAAMQDYCHHLIQGF